MSQVEYQVQLTHLSPFVCLSISASTRIVLKKCAHLAVTFPSYLLFSHNYLNLYNLFDCLIQHHLSFFHSRHGLMLLISSSILNLFVWLCCIFLPYGQHLLMTLRFQICLYETIIIRFCIILYFSFFPFWLRLRFTWNYPLNF